MSWCSFSSKSQFQLKNVYQSVVLELNCPVQLLYKWMISSRQFIQWARGFHSACLTAFKNEDFFGAMQQNKDMHYTTTCTSSITGKWKAKKNSRKETFEGIGTEQKRLRQVRSFYVWNVQLFISRYGTNKEHSCCRHLLTFSSNKRSRIILSVDRIISSWYNSSSFC